MTKLRYFENNDKPKEIVGTQADIFKKGAELHAAGVEQTWVEFDDGQTMYCWTNDLGGVNFRFE